MKKIDIASSVAFFSRFKYYIVIALGVLIIGVVDENSYMRKLEYAYQIENMKAEIEKYNKQYKHDTELLHKLKTSRNTVARIAREKYFMKMDDEDIFVLSDDGDGLETKNNSEYETVE